MAWNKLFLTAGAAALMGLGVVMANAQEANAQGYYDSDQPETVIVSPPAFTQRDLDNPHPGVYEQRISMSREVNFSDLDLNQAADRRELRDRIHDTAEAVCTDLDNHFPQEIYMPTTDQNNCVRRATEQGIARANYLIRHPEG